MYAYYILNATSGRRCFAIADKDNWFRIVKKCVFECYNCDKDDDIYKEIEKYKTFKSLEKFLSDYEILLERSIVKPNKIIFDYSC